MKAGAQLKANLRERSRLHHAQIQAREAEKAAQTKASWWVGVTDAEFTERQRERAKVWQLTSTTVSYVKPWGVI